MLAFSQQMLLPENDSSVPYRVYFLPDIACDFPSLAPQSQATLPVGVIAAAPADQTVTAQCGKHSISSTSLGQVLNGGILNAVYNDESKTLQISPDEEFLNMAFIWTSMTSQADNLCFNVSPSHENGVFSLDATDFEAAEATIPSDHCQALGNASSCTLSTDNIYVSVLAAGTFFNFSATADSQSVQTFRTKLLNAQIGPPPNPDETTSGTSTGSTSPGTKMP